MAAHRAAISPSFGRYSAKTSHGELFSKSVPHIPHKPRKKVIPLLQALTECAGEVRYTGTAVRGGKE